MIHKFLIICIMISLMLIFGCSTSNSSKDSNINIEKISIKKSASSNSKENLIDFDLTGIISDSNQKQDIDFTWKIEFLKIDIDENELNSNSSKNNKTSIKISDSTTDSITDKTSDKASTKKSEKTNFVNATILEGYYYLQTSDDNPLNATLSVYKPGYYKVTLTAKKEKKITNKSTIIKVNDPPDPKLYVKINLPKIKSSSKDDFKGYFYLSSNQEKEKKIVNNLIKLNATEMMNQWYNNEH